MDNPARFDPNTHIDTSIKALSELVEDGKINGIDLREVNANTNRKAHARRYESEGA
jgi:aryl-alcohol dehydrogenase-like predicted oxidoreductase